MSTIFSVGTGSLQFPTTPSLSPFQESSSLTLPVGFLPFVEFSAKFSLGEASTEQAHPVTMKLSEVMQRSTEDGLDLLWQVDQNVIDGLKSFAPIIDAMVPVLTERLGVGGRIFIVGSGSSGRIAFDLAAKCRQNFSLGGDKVIPVIAGGLSAVIRAKEGFEDCEKSGANCAASLGIKSTDYVICVSSSGSSPFNVGFAHEAANRSAAGAYFYNSEFVPDRTRKLFERQNQAILPWKIDIGPQAISGSTRLQGATLAEACLGALLFSTLFQLKGDHESAEQYCNSLVEKITQANQLIHQHLSEIAAFVEKEEDIFSAEDANFRKVRDEEAKGYVTFLGDDKVGLALFMDTTECSPNPVQEEKESETKRSEFRAYTITHLDNVSAWSSLVGYNIPEEDHADLNRFILSAEVEGNHSFSQRPKGKGNLLISVAIAEKSGDLAAELIEEMHTAKSFPSQGESGIILLSVPKMREEKKEYLKEKYLTLVMDEIPNDRIAQTILLKQILNLISNAAMIKMGKVEGNKMIDVRPSNGKLLDRCLRLVRSIWEEKQSSLEISSEELYLIVTNVIAIKEELLQQNIYTAPLVKTVLALLYLNLQPNRESVMEATKFLLEHKESIHWLSQPQDSYAFV